MLYGERGVWGDEERKKKSEVGRGKSTSIIGQAAVQGNVEVLARGFPLTSASDAPPLKTRRSKCCLILQVLKSRRISS